MLIFYNNIKIADQWGYLLYLKGVISFPRLSDGVFIEIEWGWGPLDGVSVKQMVFEWGCGKSMGLS